MTTAPLLFDRALLRARLDRAAPGFEAAGFLKARAAEDAVMRLEAILREFPVAVDLGARNGAFARALAASDARGKVGLLIQTDLSERMLCGQTGPRLLADEERLPFGDATLDLAVSTLALHWTNDLVGTLIQIRRALRPDGLFVGALFGGATLTELRQALLQAEAELHGGAGPRVSPFADVMDAAHLLQRAGFALPVADAETLPIRYRTPLALLHDLRAAGEANAVLARDGRIPPRALVPMALAALPREAEGIPATLRLLVMTGWAPHDSQSKPARPGSATTRLAEALGAEERSAGEKAGR
jgi:SAM-dependent methyltransferase